MTIKRMINILHIITDFSIGGAEKNLLSIVKNYDRSKFNIFVAYSFDGELENEFRKTDVHFYKFQNTKLKFKSLQGFITVFKLYKFIKKQKIDIVHTHLFVPYIWGGISAKLARVKLINSVQNIRDIYVGKVYKYLRFLEKIYAKFTNTVVVYNQTTKEIIVSRGIDISKIEVIHGGVDVSKLASYRESDLISIREKYLLYDSQIVGISGGLKPVKNHKLFLKAAAEVSKKIPDVKFVITGEGSEKEKLKILSSKLGLNDKIVFTGFVDDIYSVMAAFDIFILTSFSEGQPVIILEAMALGKPVIATAVGGVPELIKNGENGILVPSDDVRSLSVSIIDLLQNEHKRKKIALAGRKMVEDNYNIKQMVNQLERLYLKVFGF